MLLIYCSHVIIRHIDFISIFSNGSRKDGRERDRSDSTKTVTSTYSNSSNGYTNYGYDHGYDFPFNRYDRRAFKKF